MKYLYGNSMKEMILNKPIEIKSVKTLKQYQQNYNYVIEVKKNELFTRNV